MPVEVALNNSSSVILAVCKVRKYHGEGESEAFMNPELDRVLAPQKGRTATQEVTRRFNLPLKASSISSRMVL
jgi:hypothetical protein